MIILSAIQQVLTSPGYPPNAFGPANHIFDDDHDDQKRNKIILMIMMVMIKLVLYVAKFSSKLLNHQKLAKSFLSPTSSQKESNLLSFQSNFWKLSIGVISLRLRSCQFGKIRMAKNCNFIKVPTIIIVTTHAAIVTSIILMQCNYH